MKIRVCDICQPSLSELKAMILKINPKIDFDEKCQSFCGIGSSKSFVIIEGIPYYDDSNVELLKKIEGSIK